MLTDRSDGILADPSGALIYKPCTSAEIDFYQSTLSDHPDFARLMPTFMGTLQSGKSEQLESLLATSREAGASSMVLPTPELDQTIGGEVEEAVPLKGKKLETGQMLVLENVLSGFKRPNFMDVKLGKRLWADDAPPAKRARFDDVAAKTTSGSLGFRVAGMQIWEPFSSPASHRRDIKNTKVHPYHEADGSEATDGMYRAYNKMYGRGLTIENVQDAFKELLCLESGDLTVDLLEGIVRDMDSLIEEIETTLSSKECRMYSTSLLLVFEGDPEARKALIDAAIKRAVQESENMENDFLDGDGGDEDQDGEDDEVEEPRLLDVRIIDFAHADWTPGQGQDGNTLIGIQNVRRVVQGLARLNPQAS